MSASGSVLSERLLITRIVTSLGLALLLLLGFASFEPPAADRPDDTGGVHLVAGDAAGVAVVSLDPPTSAPTQGGVALALCAAGLACGMIVLMLLRRFSPRPLLTPRTRVPRPLRVLSAPVSVRSHARSPQTLGISRT